MASEEELEVERGEPSESGFVESLGMDFRFGLREKFAVVLPENRALRDDGRRGYALVSLSLESSLPSDDCQRTIYHACVVVCVGGMVNLQFILFIRTIIDPLDDLVTAVPDWEPPTEDYLLLRRVFRNLEEGIPANVSPGRSVKSSCPSYRSPDTGSKIP